MDEERSRKRREKDTAKRAAETKDWVDGTDNLVYIFYEFYCLYNNLFCSY